MTRATAHAFAAVARVARGDVWTPAVVRALHKQLGSDVLLTDLRGSVLAASPARSSIDPLQILAASADQDQSLMVVPVQVSGQTVAFLGCRFEAGVAELLDFAGAIISADLRAHQKVLQAKDEEAAAAFRDAIRGTATDDVIAERLLGVGLDVRQPFRLLVGSVDADERKLAAVAWNLHALLSEDTTVPSRMAIDGLLVTLVPDGASISQRAQRLWGQLRRLDADASVGVSCARGGVGGLRMAYAEAALAARRGPSVNQAEPLDVVTTTLLNVATPEAATAATNLLSPLVAYDRAHGGQLVQTLDAWLAHDRSAAATAEALFIHRNTLRYRLNQAEELLGERLESTATIANLTLALRIVSSASQEDATSSRPLT